MVHTLPQAALLVVGHGTRSADGQREFWLVVSQIARELPGIAVEGGFLEMGEPSIAAAMQRLSDRGAEQVVVAPLLLFAAGHVKRDIPLAAARAAARCRLSLLLAPALGCHPLLVELSALRFQQALGPHPIDPSQIAWVLVGRGSRDPLSNGRLPPVPLPASAPDSCGRGTRGVFGHGPAADGNHGARSRKLPPELGNCAAAPAVCWRTVRSIGTYGGGARSCRSAATMARGSATRVRPALSRRRGRAVSRSRS